MTHSSPENASREAILEKAIRAVIDASGAYLPPDGISKDEFINRVLGATDNTEVFHALNIRAQPAASPENAVTVTIIAQGDNENSPAEAVHHGLEYARKAGFIEAWSDPRRMIEDALRAALIEPQRIPTREEMASIVYEGAHKSLKNCWKWTDDGLDAEHPGRRGYYYKIADAVLAVLSLTRP